jgi:hypothetical protein
MLNPPDNCKNEYQKVLDAFKNTTIDVILEMVEDAGFSNERFASLMEG